MPEAASIVAVIVAVPAFSAAETLAIEIDGAVSSSVIVSVPVESLIVASVALDKVMVTVSLVSSNVSAKTPTFIVVVVCPAVMVAVPLPAV